MAATTGRPVPLEDRYELRDGEIHPSELRAAYSALDSGVTASTVRTVRIDALRRALA